MTTAAARIADLSRLLAEYLTPDELAQVDNVLTTELPIWVALPGPQTEAYNCQADVLYYGGAAGGGKSDLLLGLALTQQKHSIIFRRQSTQLIGIQSRLLDEIMKSRKGWNGQDDILTLIDRKIGFGSCNQLGEEVKYQGRPHDFVGFDEIPHFLEAQFRFLCGWMRTTTKGQRCRVVCAGNPPTDAEGAWVIDYWGPWLDPKHPKPAKNGELRWYVRFEGENRDTAVDGPEIIIRNGKRVIPQSRTFISSLVTDNPFLMDTGYEATLQALPEPLRSQMLSGDFRAGTEDSAWQVIPTRWIEAAMERWKPDGARGQMDSVGADIARGGRDETVAAPRYGIWFAPLHVWPGIATPDGPTAAGLILSIARDGAVIHVDIIGVGGSVFDHLKGNNIQVVGVNNAQAAELGAVDTETGALKFRNMRAQTYWQFREMLNPKFGENIALPPDSELKADLCAPMWKLTAGGILVEPKEDGPEGPGIKKRTGREMHRGDAVVLASIKTIKINPAQAGQWRAKVKSGSWRA